MPTDAVSAARAKLVAAVNAACLASTAGSGKIRPAGASTAAVPDQVNEVHLIPNPGGTGYRLIGELDGPTSDALEDAMGGRIRPGETAVDALSTREVLALLELMVRSGVRFRRAV